MTRQDMIRALIHLPVGAFAAWLSTGHWVLCLVFSLSFLFYEIIQDWRIKDRSYKDIFGFLIGFGILGAVITCPYR